MTAGIATIRPTAVATSASEMPAMTARRAAARIARQIRERLDDAEHGAEQPDERRVVAQRAEHAEVAFHVDAQARLGAGHRLADRLGAAVVMIETGGGHDRGRHGSARERLARALDVAASEQRAELARERIGVAARAQEDRAFHHDRHGHHGQRQEEPEHPL